MILSTVELKAGFALLTKFIAFLLYHIFITCGNNNYEVIKLTNIEKLDRDAKEYFYSLPALFQEQIIESGVSLNSKEELEKYYKSAVEKSNG